MDGRVIIVGNVPPACWKERLFKMSGLTREEFAYGMDFHEVMGKPTEARYRALDIICHGKPSAVWCLGLDVQQAFACEYDTPFRKWSGVLECDLIGIKSVFRGKFSAEDEEWIRVEFERLQPTIAFWAESRRGILTPSSED